MELLKLLAHRRAPLQLDCILPEHGRFVKLPRPLEPQELGCTTLGYGNGDGFTYLLKNMADCISILPGPPGVESTPDRPNLQIVLKGSEHLATASQPQAPWRQTSSTSTPVASASAAAAPPPQLTLRQQLSQSVMQSAAVPPSSHAPAAPLPPASLIKSESLESTDSGPQMVRLGSWLTRGKHPTSALMEYAQHQKQQQRSPTVDWTVQFTFDETGAAGNVAQSQPMTCTAMPVAELPAPRQVMKTAVNRVAAFLQLLAQSMLPSHHHCTLLVLPRPRAPPHHPTAALQPLAARPPAAATLRPNETGALRDLLNAAQRKPDGQHAPNAWTSADNVATEFASGRTTDAVGPSANSPGTTGVVRGWASAAGAVTSSDAICPTTAHVKTATAASTSAAASVRKAPRPTGTPCARRCHRLHRNLSTKCNHLRGHAATPSTFHSQQQSLSALPPPPTTATALYAPITATPPAAMRPPVAQQQQQFGSGNSSGNRRQSRRSGLQQQML